MERKGKKLAVLADGHPRRLADGRNAWRKMNDEQRAEFVRFMAEGLGYTKGLTEKRAAEICHLLALCDEHLESGCVIHALEGGA